MNLSKGIPCEPEGGFKIYPWIRFLRLGVYSVSTRYTYYTYCFRAYRENWKIMNNMCSKQENDFPNPQNKIFSHFSSLFGPFFLGGGPPPLHLSWVRPCLLHNMCWERDNCPNINKRHIITLQELTFIYRPFHNSLQFSAVNAYWKMVGN